MPNQNGRTTKPHDDERTEHYGGGQSGYGSGRYGEDRSMGPGYRNQAYGDRQYDDRQGMHTDERFTGRGGEGYWEDRTERSGYRAGSGGAQVADDHGRRYPDSYGPGEDRTRWANAPQAGMQTDWDRMRESYNRGYGGMQGNYGGPSTGYGVGNLRQPGTGGHRGKGPQGYMRSDDRIREQVCEVLADDDHIDATHVEVIVKNGEVMLTGFVEDRRQKRLAEDVIEHLPGVRDVHNQLRCGTNARGNQSSGSAVGKTETETASDKKHRA